ncbi:hypothetical protein CHUAL_010802 [Chamberlinius hualienensis]
MASDENLLLRRKLRQLGLRHLPAIPMPIPDITSHKERLKRSLMLHSARPVRTMNNTTLTKLPRVEMRPIPPLNPQWIQRILSRFNHVSSEVTKSKLEKILIEVQQLHNQVISSLSVRQVLLIPGQNRLHCKKIVREWPELSVTRKKAFIKHRCQLQRKLFLLDPSFRMLLTLCRDSFAHIVILESSTFDGRSALECKSLLDTVHHECFKFEDKILHSWFPEVVKIVSTAGKSKSGQEACSFYKCVTSVLSAQLKDLVYRSVHGFVNICRSGLLIFMLALEVANGSIIASPTINELSAVIISGIFKQITDCLKNIPTVDSWLSGGAVTMMAVDLPDTVIAEAQSQVTDILRLQYGSPQTYILDLTSKYSHLLNGESMKAIGDFLKLPHPFKDYCQLIERYQDLTYVIGVIPDMKPFSVFSLNCRHLKEVLLKETLKHRDHLLNFVADLNRQSNYNLCRGLAEVKGRTSKVPETTKQMVTLRIYTDRVETLDLPKLESEAKYSYERLLFLLNLYDFNEDDFTLNGFTLTVPARIRPIITKTRELLDDCHLRFEEALQNRIEKVGLEIEKLQFRVKELDDCGQLSLIAQYVQDGKSIRRRIEGLDHTRQFRINMPIINALCQPGIRPRHWKQMASILNFEIVPESSSTSTTLNQVLKLDLYPYLEALEVVTAAAAKEYATERSIRKLLHEWDHVSLTTIQFRDTGKLILSSIDDVQQMLDDHIVKIQTIRGSLYIGPFEEEVTLWEKKLVRTVETLDKWLHVQSQWIYLEPIFSSEDIVRQMPKEGVLFEKVDREWVDIMKVVRRDARVMSTAGDEDMLTKLQAADTILEEINVGLEFYLEQKRLDFPRFFFLSNDEMLEILSETKDPHRVQPHLLKCFEGIGRLEFNQNTIVAMESVEGEKVQLFDVINPANAKGQVEKWLLEVQESMKNSVRRHLVMAQEVYNDEERTTWVKNWPGQIVLAVTQLYWTGKVHDAIINGPIYLENYAESIKKRMVDVVDLVRSDCLTQQLRTTLNSLLVLDVHARDVVNQLLSSNVNNVDDFKWLSQLRYYWIENELSVQMVNTIIKYCYEYLGNTSRLVMTPLTDRCYRTLVAAFHLHLNGAPEGPAGTGKTETVKDLAKAIAVQCVVFNCSDGLDYLAMGKFFKGLTCTGAWACFDEFNRIESEVLSVVAEQMLTIVLAVRANSESFVFEGTRLVLNRNCFTCITMNPNYAGRSQLPDNLKALFRTVAMMVPDYVTIAEWPLQSHIELLQVAENVCHKRNLQPEKPFMEKLAQVYETMLVRHGFMLVGDAMGSKTTLLRVLAEALSELGKPVQWETINPKSMPLSCLYGQFDPASHEWTDGIVAHVFRKYSSSTDTEGYKWIIFDGPVDPVWIENLNAVLDDNRKLCLMSGEVVPMSNCMRIVFEVSDLLHASPATVSRCGMIYIQPEVIGWLPLVKSFIDKVSNACWYSEGFENLLGIILDWILPPTLEFMCHQRHLVIDISTNYLVDTCLDMLNGIMTNACSSRKETEIKYGSLWLIASSLFALIWSIGALLNADGRQEFSFFIRQILSGKMADSSPIPAEVAKVDFIWIPHDGAVFDYYYEFRQRGQWRLWNDMLWSLEAQIDPQSSVWQLTVPTVDMVRCEHLLELNCRKPLLIVGPTGTGKTTYVNHYLAKNEVNGVTTVLVSMAGRSEASQTQDVIIGELEKRRKGTYGPPLGKKCVVFIDDLHRPSKETYGAQPPLELFKQYLDHGHWFDKKELTKLKLIDVNFVATATTYVGQQQLINNRMLRHFHIVDVNAFNLETLQRIFSTTLNHHFRTEAFPSEHFSVLNSIVGATLYIYTDILHHLLPTPQKMHYVFNLRDVSSVILGCCRIKKAAVVNKRTFTRLWIHEMLRIFNDKLIDGNDRSWLFGHLREGVKLHFKDNFDVVCERMATIKNRKIIEEDLQHLMFGDYLKPHLAIEDRLYEEVVNVDQFSKVCEDSVLDYNNANKTRMQLVLTPYVLQHLSRLCRVFRISRGHILLVGVSGVGRQTLTRLAAFISGLNVVKPEMNKNYSRNEWREDIKSLLRTVGTQGKPTVFLLTDNYLRNELFLEDVESLLKSAEVSNLFSPDERQEIVQMLRSEGSQQTYATFVNRCRENLHLVLIINSKSAIFLRQLHIFPSLVTCCTINYMSQWPNDTIEKVAYNQLQSLDLGNCQNVIVPACQFFHSTCRDLNEDNITPMTFLQLLETFKNLLNKREKKLMMSKERYKAGLAKLSASSQQIALMQEELETLKPRLEDAASNSRLMMEAIASESKELEQKKNILKEDESVFEKKAQEANALREECEADLAEAVPALDAAVASLDTLKPADITVLKSMKNPPPAVKLVTEAVCVMLDIPPEKSTEIGLKKKILDYWGPSKKMLGELSFLSKLKTYNKDELKESLMSKIRKEYLPNPDFDLLVVSKASSAAEGLCKWICAMELYDRMAKVVAPKKCRLAEAEDLVTSLLSTLRSKRGELSVTESHLSNLQRQLEETINEKETLEKQINLCTVKLGRARHLIDGLAEERNRWNNEVALIDETLKKLVGDTLLAAGVVTYLGPFKIIQRRSVVEEWTDFLKEQSVAYSENFSLATVLGDPLEIQTWIIAGLPNDRFSIDNAVIVSNTIKWPLMIDPQCQALNWLKAVEGDKGLVTVKPFAHDYPRHLEACVQNGQTILIENIGEDLDPLLEPLLLKETFKQAGIEMIRYGDKSIEYNHSFRLMMSSRLHDPHYLPEVATKVSIVNFCVTPEGLEDQLLGLLVARERPELETAHRNLVLECSNNRLKLRDLEDKVLATMSTSKGNLLDDETAIKVLDTSKQVSMEILIKQKAAEINEEKISQSRKIYQPVANHAAILYFAVANLYRVDPMYHFSLNWFIKLFLSSIDLCEKNEEVNTRLHILTNCLTYSVYINVSRSIFEKDKLLLSFLLYISLLRGRGSITEQEITFFLTGGIGFSRPENNPFRDWLDERAWMEINSLVTLKGHFQNIKEEMLSNESQWREYTQHSHPHLQSLPAPTNRSLNSFQCLCILRCLRPDKVISGVITVLKMELGDSYIHSVPFNLEKSYKESDATTPLLFLLSTGNDPLTGWLNLAKHKNIPESKCHIISLGQGQGTRAIQVVEQAKEKGDWVLLQNCHLAVKWLSDLESLCESLTTDTVNPNFRLWLTSYSSNKFPVAICQNSIKITNEAPTGLKQRLLQIYTNEPLNESSFFKFEGKNENNIKGFLKLVYGLSLFHASVCERRKYGSIGWNISYVFDPFDLVISLHQLKMFVSEYTEIPFEAITYMIGECNYGGRVTDHWDRRVLVNLLNDLCNPYIVTDDNYKLIPQLNSYEEYLENIKKMNAEQDPEVYGLHPNVDISKNIQDSQMLRDSLLLTLDSHFEVAGTSRAASKQGDDTMGNLLKSILEKLPENFNITEAERKFPVIYTDSMNNLLTQEMQRYNSLLDAIRNSCQQLERAWRGMVAMTTELESISTSLMLGKIPSLWASQSYPSIKPIGSYLEDLNQRICFLRKWMNEGKPKVFWLPGFYFTHGFLTAVIQNHARKHSVPIDQIVFDFEFLSDYSVTKEPADGVYIDGLFLEGAMWDPNKKIIVEQENNVLFYNMPIIWLKPIITTDSKCHEHLYECPLYKTRLRQGTLSTTGHSTNYILTIMLPTALPPNHWVKRGTVLICQLDS